jgi:CubicO group peptidase (beta-lactamase class C family)
MYSWVDEGVRVVDGRSELKASAVRRTRCANRRHWAGYDFWVPPEKLARLIDPPVGFRGRPRMWDVTQPTTLFSGGGLVSTAADYLRFCQMLLNGGELDGVRIVKAATVRQMTTDALPPEIRFAEVDGVAMGPQTGATWGLGFALRNSAAGSQVPGSLGSFTRSGIWGTYFWVDPAEQLIAQQLMQVAPGRGSPFIRAFRNLTYGAFTIPDHGVPASAATPAAIDAAALESYTGTYAFSSISTRDQQAVGPGVLLAREFGGSAST